MTGLMPSLLYVVTIRIILKSLCSPYTCSCPSSQSLINSSPQPNIHSSGYLLFLSKPLISTFNTTKHNCLNGVLNSSPQPNIHSSGYLPFLSKPLMSTFNTTKHSCLNGVLNSSPQPNIHSSGYLLFLSKPLMSTFNTTKHSCLTRVLNSSPQPNIHSSGYLLFLSKPLMSTFNPTKHDCLTTRVLNPVTHVIFSLKMICVCLFFFVISLIADGHHRYHPTCGHKGSSHLSPVHALQFFLSRCKFSTLTTRQPMVEFYLLTFPRFPLRKKEHKSYFGKNRTHDLRTSRCAGYLLDHSGDEGCPCITENPREYNQKPLGSVRITPRPPLN